MSDEFNRQMVMVTNAAAWASMIPKEGTKEDRLYAALCDLNAEEDWFREAARIYAEGVK